LNDPPMSKYLNPNFEARNEFQFPNFQKSLRRVQKFGKICFKHLRFVFRYCFGFRASDLVLYRDDTTNRNRYQSLMIRFLLENAQEIL